MNILHVTDTYLPVINGVVVAVSDTVQEQRKQGHQVKIIEPRAIPSFPFPIYEGFRIGVVTPTVLKEIERFNPDIIHIHTPFFLGWQVWRWARRKSIPIVTTYHTHLDDPNIWKVFPWFTGWLRFVITPLLMMMVKFFLSGTAGVVAPSVDTKNKLMQMKVDKNIGLIPSGVNIALVKKGEKKGKLLREEYELDGKQTMIYVGRVSPEKKVSVLLSVLKELVKTKETQNIKLIVIGGGPNLEQCKLLAKELDVDQSIIWFGMMDHQKLLSNGYYYLGDVFVTASTFETQGLTMVEAMAAELPVVAFDSRGNREVVGQAGELVSTDNSAAMTQALIKMFTDKTYFNAFKKKTSFQAHQFSLESRVAKLTSFYQEICDTIHTQGAQNKYRRT